MGLVVVGLTMIGFGASGLSGVPISLALLPLGFAALIAGIILPRIKAARCARRWPGTSVGLCLGEGPADARRAAHPARDTDQTDS